MCGARRLVARVQAQVLQLLAVILVLELKLSAHTGIIALLEMQKLPYKKRAVPRLPLMKQEKKMELTEELISKAFLYLTSQQEEDYPNRPRQGRPLPSRPVGLRPPRTRSRTR